MGRRIGVGTTTKDYITGAALPSYSTGRYAVIPHAEVIDMTLNILRTHNLEVDKELYRCNQNAEVVQGVYHIKGSQDPELQMMFAWCNSYDKSKRFQCCVGATLTVNYSYCIAGDMSTWTRKHTGNAKMEAMNQINDQLVNCNAYYSRLIRDKQTMKGIIINTKLRAETLGRLLFQEKLITLEQASVIKSQIASVPYDYNSDPDSLWYLYNHINVALKRAHPRDWLDSQREIHSFLEKEFFTFPVINEPTLTEVIVEASLEVKAETPNEDEPISFEL